MFQHIAKLLSQFSMTQLILFNLGLKATKNHLKRIIVIPAVYKSLARLEPGLRYLHWADVTDYTNLRRLAVGCVFVKQSDLPCYCTL